jgi:O-methyltransferase
MQLDGRNPELTSRRPTAKRRVADFFIIRCGLRRLHNTRVQSVIRAILDEVDLQHLRDNSRCHICVGRSGMYRFIQSSIVRDEPIDFLEFGVFQGDSIRQWSVTNKHPESRFYGFDSFEGLPEAWRRGQGKSHFDMRGAVPEIADDRVKLIKGWFDEALPEFLGDFVPKNRLLLHLDADLYSSTLVPLVYFTRYLRGGSLLIFDEFYDRNHEFKAFQDFLKISKKQYRVVCQTQNYRKVCIELH